MPAIAILDSGSLRRTQDRHGPLLQVGYFVFMPSV